MAEEEKSVSMFMAESFSSAERFLNNAVESAQKRVAKNGGRIVVEDLNYGERADGRGKVWSGSVEEISSDETTS